VKTTPYPHSLPILLFAITASALGLTGLHTAVAGSGRDSALDLADADNIHHLDAMNVEAREEVGAGWRPTRQVSATRISTPIGDIPRSVSVITAEVMSDLGEERIDRALDFAGGATRSNNFGGLSNNSYTIRGFSSANYRNGFAAGRGENTQPDAVTIERVEVLKGPSSGLFGRADPGGIVNLVTKRPQRERFARISASAGSWDYYRSTLDLNGPLSGGGTVLGRFNMALEDAGSFRNHVSSQRYVFAPSVSWQLTPKTLFLLEDQYIRNDNVFDRGIPTIDGKFGQVSIKNFYGEPHDGKFKSTHHTLQASLEHQLADHWKLRIASQYYRGHLRGAGSEVGAATPSTPPSMLPRNYRWRNYLWTDLHNHLELHGEFTLFGWTHQVLIGGEYEHFRFDRALPLPPYSDAYAVDIFNPSQDYGQSPPPYTGIIADTFDREKSYALNIQDQVYFTERFTGQIGARHESIETYSQHRVTGQVTHYDRDATVPNFGLLYKFTPQVSGFVSASRSFKPNGFDSIGNVYDPEEGRGYEVGSKLNLLGGRLGANLAFFHITKKNVLTTHPDPSVIDLIAVGEQRSRGFDIQVTGKVTESLRIIAAYAYIDAEITKDNRPNYQGSRLANVPEHSASMFAIYELPHGIEIGSSYSYIDSRKYTVTNALSMPSYQITNLFFRWRIRQHLDVTLNLNNLFDEEYYPRAHTQHRVVPGEPRHFRLTLTQKF